MGSSIGNENFQKMKNFVINLLMQSNLGQHGVRVGLITYNRRPTLRFHMNEMENHQQAINAVDSIVYEGRGTNTGAAIKWVVENAFRPEFGDRPEVPNKVLLITDGRARDPPVLKVQSGRLRSSQPSTPSVSANRSTTSSSTESLPILPSVTCFTSTTSVSSSEPSKSPLCLAFSATKSASNNFCPESSFFGRET